MSRQMSGVAAAILLLAVSAATAARSADTVADFYAGKQVTFIVGSDPGGGYDALARLVGKHLTRFVPGHPVFVIQNMPGAGSILMSNRIYNTAPKDGTVIGLVQRGILLSQVTGMPGIHYDLDKFNWIGSVAAETSVLVSRLDSEIRTVADLKEKELIVGGTGTTSDAEATARLLNAAMGTRLRIVSGYAGTNDIVAALDRGEVTGNTYSWSVVKAKDMQRSLNILLQIGMVKEPDLPGVPLALDYMPDGIDRRVSEIFFTQLSVARPIMAAAEFPSDRLAAMREAFMTMARDADFRADAVRTHLEVSPTSHEAIDRFLGLVRATSPEVVRRLTEMLNPSKG